MAVNTEMLWRIILAKYSKCDSPLRTTTLRSLSVIGTELDRRHITYSPLGTPLGFVLDVSLPVDGVASQVVSERDWCWKHILALRIIAEGWADEGHIYWSSPGGFGSAKL